MFLLLIFVRALLDQLGIDRTALTNIDKVDAALCAYMAHLAATGADLHTYGELITGLIVVPPLAKRTDRRTTG